MGRGSACAGDGGARAGSRLHGGGALARRAILRAVDAPFLTIIGAVLAVGLGLAGRGAVAD